MSGLALPERAMVLAAGLGLRMRPLTEHKPKPLIPVAGVTLIDRALDWLAASGIGEAVVNSHYKAEMLEAHLAARQSPRLRISYESVVLETGGGIRKALPLLGARPFFSVNSDTICLDGSEPALHRMARAWQDDAMDALLLLQPVERAVGYDGAGDFFADVAGQLRRRGGEKAAPFVFTGVQLLHPRLFEGSPEGPFSMNILYDRDLTRVRAVIHDGGWLHVGDPAGLAQAEQWLKERVVSA